MLDFWNVFFPTKCLCITFISAFSNLEARQRYFDNMCFFVQNTAYLNLGTFINIRRRQWKLFRDGLRSYNFFIQEKVLFSIFWSLHEFYSFKTVFAICLLMRVQRYFTSDFWLIKRVQINSFEFRRECLISA